MFSAFFFIHFVCFFVLFPETQTSEPVATSSQATVSDNDSVAPATSPEVRIHVLKVIGR